jgi:hypothetical protein
MNARGVVKFKYLCGKSKFKRFVESEFMPTPKSGSSKAPPKSPTLGFACPLGILSEVFQVTGKAEIQVVCMIYTIDKNVFFLNFLNPFMIIQFLTLTMPSFFTALLDRTHSEIFVALAAGTDTVCAPLVKHITSGYGISPPNMNASNLVADKITQGADGISWNSDFSFYMN